MLLPRLLLFHLIGTLQLCSSLTNFKQLQASHLTAHPLAGRPGARLLQVRARVLRPCSLVLRLHVHLTSDCVKSNRNVWKAPLLPVCPRRRPSSSSASCRLRPRLSVAAGFPGFRLLNTLGVCNTEVSSSQGKTSHNYLMQK